MKYSQMVTVFPKAINHVWQASSAESMNHTVPATRTPNWTMVITKNDTNPRAANTSAFLCLVSSVLIREKTIVKDIREKIPYPTNSTGIWVSSHSPLMLEAPTPIHAKYEAIPIMWIYHIKGLKRWDDEDGAKGW